jgi:thiamine-phosphate diphosphorylase/hydroxyethylthiazole kinase
MESYANYLSMLRHEITDATIKTEVPAIVTKLRKSTPLCHNMTNLVVQNFAANVAICIGASPIMSNNGLEAADLVWIFKR